MYSIKKIAVVAGSLFALTAGVIGVANAQDSTTTTKASTATTLPSTGNRSSTTDATQGPDNDGDGPHGGRGGHGHGHGGGNFDPSKGGHQANNITEVVLTGDSATKATAAALAAVPGGTIERVETDAEGAVYEAHMTKADGSHVTVKFNADYTVKGIEDGMR
jgi:hypothetical protein